MITRIVKFTVPTEHIDAFKVSFAEAATGSLKEPGFEQARLFVTQADANTFYAYERLRDQETHASMPHVRQLFDFLASSGTQIEQFNLGETDPAPEPLLTPEAENDEELAVFFIFSLRPGFKGRVLAQFADHTRQARKEPGNVVFDLYTVEGNDDTLIVYERWKNEAALMKEHFAQPYAQITGALLAEAVPGELTDAMQFSTEIR